MNELKIILSEFIQCLDSSMALLTAQDSRNKSYVTCLWTFWEEMKKCTKNLCQECNKFCLMFMKPPLPEPAEVKGLLTQMKKAVENLVVTSSMLPSKFGDNLLKEVNEGVTQSIEAVKNLLEQVINSPSNQLGDILRQSTGMVWNLCEALDKCPRNNTLAVLSAVKNESAMVSDAFLEINEALKGDGADWNDFTLGTSSLNGSMEDDEPKTWSEEDKTNIKVPVNLVKAVKLMYKRVIEALEACPSSKFGVQKPNGSDSSSLPLHKWSNLDQMREIEQKISEAVDNFVLSLYPPVDYNNVKKNSHIVVGLSLAVLDKLRESCVGSEDTGPHISFLHNAFKHNESLVDSKLPNRE